MFFVCRGKIACVVWCGIRGGKLLVCFFVGGVKEKSFVCWCVCEPLTW